MKKLQITFLALLLTGTIFSCREKEEEFIKTTNPEVSITNYQGGETVHSIITLEIEATDTEGVEKVEVYVNGDLAETLTSQPYAFEINTFSYEDGPLQIKVEAHDAYGNKGMVERALIVDNVLVTISTENMLRKTETMSYVENVYIFLSISGMKDGVETIIFDTEIEDFKEYKVRRPEWFHEDVYNYTYALRRVRESFLNPSFSQDNLFITDYQNSSIKSIHLGNSTISTPNPSDVVGNIVVTYDEELQSIATAGTQIWYEQSGGRTVSIIDGKRYEILPVRTTSEIDLFINLGLSDENFREYSQKHKVGDTIELNFTNTIELEKKKFQLGTASNWSVTQTRMKIIDNQFQARGPVHFAMRSNNPGKTEIALPISQNSDYYLLSASLLDNDINYNNFIYSKEVPTSFERLSDQYQITNLGNNVYQLELLNDFTYAALTQSIGPVNNRVDLYHVLDKTSMEKYEIRKPLLSERIAKEVADFPYENIIPVGVSKTIDTRFQNYGESLEQITNAIEYKRILMSRPLTVPDSENHLHLKNGYFEFELKK